LYYGIELNATEEEKLDQNTEMEALARVLPGRLLCHLLPYHLSNRV